MNYSFKTLTVAAMLFLSSMLIIGAMHLPLFNGADGFEAMEDTFNSLRKGVKPPFLKIEKENTENLGKNFNITLTFRSSDEARAITMMFLRNKLTVTPKGRKINIQGDFGYTLKFFMSDIHLLYMNRFTELERRYSMPATQSMYYLNRILQKMAVAMNAQKKETQEKLIKKIRNKLLIPAYNLREALPVTETSGFTYLSLGTLGILLFAILWDISNFLFFGTLASNDFMKTIRVKMGRELSDAEKKRLAIRKKKMAKAMAARKKKAQKGEKIKSTRTNKDALKAKPKAKKKNPEAADKKVVKKKKRTPEEIEKLRRQKAAAQKAKGAEAPKPKSKNSKKKADAPEAAIKPAKKKKASAADKQPAKTQVAKKKKRPVKKDAEGKTVRKTVGSEKGKEPTSQNKGKKVTTQQGRKKVAPKPDVKAKPEKGSKLKKKAAAQATKKKPERPPQTVKKEIKPDE